MSMTQVAILRKSEIPDNDKIEKDIQRLGYNFEIINKEEDILSGNGLECKINGHKTYFETYVENPTQIANEIDFIKSDLSNEDVGITFVWGADFAAGACIGLISIALIDNCNAKIYYLDDEMKYTREMLINDMPQFLIELSKIGKPKPEKIRSVTSKQIEEIRIKKKQSFWDKLKNIFK